MTNFGLQQLPIIIFKIIIIIENVVRTYACYIYSITIIFYFNADLF